MVFLHGKYQIYKGKEVKSAGGKEIEKERLWERECECVCVCERERERNDTFEIYLDLISS